MNRLQIAINSFCSKTPQSEESICTIFRNNSLSRKNSTQSFIMSLDLQSTPLQSVERNQEIQQWRNITQLNDRLRSQLSEFELNKVREVTALQNRLFDQHETAMKNIRQSYESQIQILKSDNQRLREVISNKNDEILKLVHSKQRLMPTDNEHTRCAWFLQSHHKESEFQQILQTLADDMEEQKFQIAILEEENRELISQLQNSEIERIRERDNYELRLQATVTRSERQIYDCCDSRDSRMQEWIAQLENYRILEEHVRKLEDANQLQIQNLMLDIKHKQDKINQLSQYILELQIKIQSLKGQYDSTEQILENNPPEFSNMLRTIKQKHSWEKYQR